MKATTGEAAGSGAGGGEAPVTGRGALAGEGASGPVCLVGGCGHAPPRWSPAATGHAVGHRVVARPLPLPAPPVRHARPAFVNNAGPRIIRERSTGGGGRVTRRRPTRAPPPQERS